MGCKIKGLFVQGSGRMEWGKKRPSGRPQMRCTTMAKDQWEQSGSKAQKLRMAKVEEEEEIKIIFTSSEFTIIIISHHNTRISQFPIITYYCHLHTLFSKSRNLELIGK